MVKENLISIESWRETEIIIFYLLIPQLPVCLSVESPERFFFMLRIVKAIY